MDYTTRDGTATSGADYVAASGTISFPDGDASDKNFVVPILEDTMEEGAEILYLSLSNPTGGAVISASSEALLTIMDNETLQETPWVDDATPAGASLYGTWNWVSGDDPMPLMGNLAHQSTLASGVHQHYFVYASETLSVYDGRATWDYAGKTSVSAPPGLVRSPGAPPPTRGPQRR